MEYPGLLPWAQEPRSHKGPQSPPSSRPEVVKGPPGEGLWDRGAHAQSQLPLPRAPPFLPLLSQLPTS